MHSDGYAGFGALARAGPIREVACLAHVRRKFFDVYAAQGSAIAAETLERIAFLYAIENESRGLPPESRAAIRRAKAAPRLDELERWLQMQLPKIPETALAISGCASAYPHSWTSRSNTSNSVSMPDSSPAAATISASTALKRTPRLASTAPPIRRQSAAPGALPS